MHAIMYAQIYIYAKHSPSIDSAFITCGACQCVWRGREKGQTIIKQAQLTNEYQEYLCH